MLQTNDSTFRTEKATGNLDIGQLRRQAEAAHPALLSQDANDNKQSNLAVAYCSVLNLSDAGKTHQKQDCTDSNHADETLVLKGPIMRYKPSFCNQSLFIDRYLELSNAELRYFARTPLPQA